MRTRATEKPFPGRTERAQASEDARKPRSDGEQSRERLLLSATHLFAKHGYAKASTREIAQSAQANVAAISYYFGDKAGLYRAVFDCVPNAQSQIARYNQPGFTLRQSLLGYYGQMLEPLKQGELARLWLRVWFREMVEPTGLLENKIEHHIRPKHQALVGVLCRHLGVAEAEADDAIHRLAFAVAGLALQAMLGGDVVSALRPQLIASCDAIDQWAAHMAGYAEAMIAHHRITMEEGRA